MSATIVNAILPRNSVTIIKETDLIYNFMLNARLRQYIKPYIIGLF